jgi:regulator of protease activity HflC (stomatin/prohibitin superfamily)
MVERVVFGGGSDKSIAAIRRIVIVVGGLLLLAWIGCSTVTRVDAGHVGVRVKLAGSARGVQDMPTVQGWVFFNPLTEQIVQFPTSVQNVVWTLSATEGSPHDDSITFSSKEGASVNADLGIAFHIDPAMAPKLYARFRQPDLKILANTFIRNAVRESINEVGSTMGVQEIYGAGKNKLIADVQRKVREVLAPEGMVLDQLTINGALRLPENVVGAINRALEATQNAYQAENRVRQIRAEADQAITSATGAAEAARQRAKGEADAVLIRARAEAQANEIIRLSTTPTVLAYRQIEKWDGRLPTYSSGQGLPMPIIDLSKLPEVPEADRKKALADALAATPSAASSPTPAAPAAPAGSTAPVAPTPPPPAQPPR